MIIPAKTSIKILNHFLLQMKEMGLFPVIGAEIEFYLSPLDNSQFDSSWQAQQLDLNFIVEKEKGLNQFEVKIQHSEDIHSQIEEILNIKRLINEQATKQGMTAIFNAKPFINQPGNALHIHLHIENSCKENMYIKQKDEESPLFLKSIAGLCSTMKETTLLFAPYEQAYTRYQQQHVNSPSKICWGGNNRSAAIRIPLDQKFNRRLEHRIACADSAPIEVIIAILYGVIKGIKENLSPPEKLHGNAFLEQYDFPKLAYDYNSAREDFICGSLNKMFNIIAQ